MESFITTIVHHKSQVKEEGAQSYTERPTTLTKLRRAILRCHEQNCLKSNQSSSNFTYTSWKHFPLCWLKVFSFRQFLTLQNILRRHLSFLFSCQWLFFATRISAFWHLAWVSVTKYLKISPNIPKYLQPLHVNIYSYKQPSSPCWRGLASPWPSLFLQRCSFQPGRTPLCRPDPAYSPSAWCP